MVGAAANSAGMARRRQNPAAKGEGAARRKSFGEVLRDLLIEQGYTTSIGNPDWPRFAQGLGDIQYETLRKAITRERDPSLKVMEACAEALGIAPDTFWEYRLAQVQRMFDPREVGEDEAYANLQNWIEKSG